MRQELPQKKERNLDIKGKALLKIALLVGFGILMVSGFILPRAAWPWAGVGVGFGIFNLWLLFRLVRSIGEVTMDKRRFARRLTVKLLFLFVGLGLVFGLTPVEPVAFLIGMSVIPVAVMIYARIQLV